MVTYVLDIGLYIETVCCTVIKLVIKFKAKGYYTRVRISICIIKYIQVLYFSIIINSYGKELYLGIMMR